MERTLKNGTRYSIYELFKGYVVMDAFYNGKWNRLTRNFKSIDEAMKWCDKEDYEFEHPAPDVPMTPVPDDYYDDTRRFFGD